ncbi:hypothetical protein RM530_07685 [Algiphilus sp. W345]|uniref:PhoD-like phosphatase metallophosphatase domain-containing protein n=1 Tax=Banduia mediterranea TaxID=3075609 RepID=A0ABU2WI54_9GAMM|nr:hypothetical protein [Algiphilus sp. W345]MDT0497245.1 hypothetical protein [Algiphilus sp. W345]
MSQFYLAPGQPFGLGSWGGCVDQRSLFDAFAGEDFGEVVVLSGDVHTAFCAELTKDPTDFFAYTAGASGAVRCRIRVSVGDDPRVSAGRDRGTACAEGALKRPIRTV